MSPGCATASGAKVTASPTVSSRGAFSWPTRMRGPWRSTRTATGSPRAPAAARTNSIQRPRSSVVPCEALTRITLAPASSRAAMRASVPVAGPRVATIFVRRITTPARGFSTMLPNRGGTEGTGGTRSLHDFDLSLFQPPFELAEQMRGAGDGGGGESLDRARGEPPLQLPDAEQHFQAAVGEGDTNATVVLGVRRGFNESLGFEALHERRRRGARHPHRHGDLTRPGAIRAALVHGHQGDVGAMGEPPGAEGAVPGPQRGSIGGGDGVAELQRQLGAIGHRGGRGGIIVNMLMVNILI